jgi:hypothetical protein
MAQNTDEMASIVIGDDRDECVTYTPANDHYRQKSPDTVVGSTCGREEHACGHRNRYRRGDGKSTGAPFMKEVENGIQLPMPELAVQVSLLEADEIIVKPFKVGRLADLVCEKTVWKRKELA